MIEYVDDEDAEFYADYDDDQIESIIEQDELDEEEPVVSENAFSILKQLNTNKKKMYFDEERVKHLIVDEYQPYLEYGINAKGKRVCINRDKASKEVEKEIMGNLLLIANAIINKYKYWRFEPTEDLQAEAMQAMWCYLPNYVPGKGTAFNLFSIICKKCLLNYTTKNYRNRDTSDIDVCYDLSSREEVNYDLLFDSIEKTFLEVINKHYVKDKRKNYIELTEILMKYLDENKAIVGKNDLLSTFKEYGHKRTEYKKFIEEMSQYKDEFYSLINN